ncbi:DUF4159 domain-containing protein [Magnetospirillum sp. UT-4]|uniref:DUF4159 domain-containing protein n=1 Tax=Magnetospirillum sp. UT-4 TaxID=2681467 RepID=UPI00137FDE73|nr:DUF4159 domain-containing protein [Magnetospirillum sp. UT-4]CAA7617692.1 N-terminal double-transmembrane domain protein [Magnetospirillum sp. UT-4]
MLELGPLAFATPWALAVLPALPLLWWLLRVVPPAPRRVDFPPVRLLFGLDAREDSAARTPWWVVALRLVLALCVILGLAHPLFNPGRPMAAATAPLVVAVDDGWASARDWSARAAWLDDLLARAERAGRPVVLLATAPPADGAPVAASPVLPAAAARSLAAALEPKPWPPDRAAAAAAVRAIPRDRVMAAVWLSDGLEDGHGAELAQALQTLGGGLDLATGQAGRLLLPPDPGNGAPVVRRLAGLERPERVAVRGIDGAGRVLARAEAELAPGEADIAVPLRLPAELRNRLVRLDIEAEAGAGAVALLDEGWRRRPVGLVAAGADGPPLLAPTYYVERALAPHAELHRGSMSELLQRKLSLLVLADLPVGSGAALARLRRWVDEGGVLLRFAGPALAQDAGAGSDALLPVRLRDGGRALGGAMSWTEPQGLSPFPAESPLAGLAVPADVRVSAQVLAEPDPALSERTWARLADGTPLVTAARHGKGWVVLVHTTANAEWSNLALSGLFVDMLRRFAQLGEGVAAAGTAAALPPAELLDGFGRLGSPGAAAAALSGSPAAMRPGPRHPPGLYGRPGALTAFNLAPAVGRLQPLRPPPGVAAIPLDRHARERDLQPALLAAALVLAILDLLVALSLRGLLARGAAAGVALLLAVAPAAAADRFALEATLVTRLAYVRTGDAAADRKSQAGLATLSRVVGQRTTAVLGEPMAVDLEADPVLFFPLLYWPATSAQAPPSEQAAARLDAYMRAGGLVVIDTGAQGDAAGLGDPELVRTLTEGLTLPALAPVGDDHVLTRSFYLLRELPGRWDGPVWAASGDMGGRGDGVSPVVVGGNDWAAAWAADERGHGLYAVVPGGERQRETALRFGINLVMYALTGNYKADQVHLPAILERLGR